MYANLKRIEYEDYGYGKNKCSGLFCRMNNLLGNRFAAMRFYFADSIFTGKFEDWTSVSRKTYFSGEKMYDEGDGIKFREKVINTEEDFYITFVYIHYNEKNLEINKQCDEFMKENKCDKVITYLNGEYYGETYSSSEIYDVGLKSWNQKGVPFFIGCSPVFINGNIYYLKGSVYTTRLYTTSLTPEQVKVNYDMTLKYRDSFKDE